MFTQLVKNRRASWFPAKGDPKGTILFLPGFPKYPGASEFGNLFHSKRYNVLVPMYSGTFDSAGKFSIRQAVADAYLWYKFLERGFVQFGPDKKKKIPRSPLILASTSFGGLVAGMTLKEHDLPRVKKCIFVSPLWDINADDASHIRVADETEKLLAFAYPMSYRFDDKKKFFDEIRGATPLSGTRRHFKDQKKQFFVFCGRDDKMTPVHMATELAKENKNTKLYILGGGHSSQIAWGKFAAIIKRIL